MVYFDKSEESTCGIKMAKAGVRELHRNDLQSVGKERANLVMHARIFPIVTGKRDS